MSSSRPPGPKSVGQVSLAKLWRTMYEHFAGFRRRIVLGAGLSTVVAVLEAGVLFSIAILGPMVTSHAQTYTRGFGGREVTLGRTPLLIAALTMLVLRGVFGYIGGRYAFLTSSAYGFNKRLALMAAFTHTDWETQSEETAGAMQNGVWSNVSQARAALQTTFDSTGALAGLVIMLAASFAAAGAVTLVLILALAFMAWIVRPIMRATHRASEHLRDANLRVADDINEVAAMAREVRVFGIPEPLLQRSSSILQRLQDATLAGDLTGLRLNVIYSNAVYMSAVVGLGVLLAVEVKNPTPYAAMVLLLYRAFGYGNSLQAGYQNMVRTLPYIEAVDEQLERYQRHAEHYGTAQLEAISSIEFDDVCFSYVEGRQVINDLSFSISPRESIGIVGPSGGGKSTLVQLLLRLRRPESGQYLVAGQDAQAFDLLSFTRQVTYVPQDPVLFDQPVLANVISMRPDISEERAVEALRQAHLLDEILAMPNGLQTMVGERGSRLSGGQRQRLCIARALAGDPEVIVLDEPTSALDPHSEEAISATLEGLRGDVALIVVAHRLSTLRYCDRIFVLRNGVLEASGTRDEVERSSPYFAESLKLSRLA